MKAIILAALCACGSTANDYNGITPAVDAASVVSNDQDAQLASCVSGTWLVRFLRVSCPACIFCSGIVMPPSYTVDMQDTISFVNTMPKLTISDKNQCVYTSPSSLRYTYGDVENGEIRQERFIWNGEIVFSKFSGSIVVAPGFTEEFHDAEVGRANLSINDCLITALFIKE